MSILSNIYDQAILKFRSADYKVLDLKTRKFQEQSKKLNEVQAREAALDFVMHWYAVANKLVSHKTDKVLVPNGDKKGDFKTVPLYELVDFINNTKQSKKHPILVGNTETRKARQKITAEVFTPDPLVNEMLGELPKSVWENNGDFCDPACGNGQFLIWLFILKVQAGYDPLDALKTIYGVELQKDNVEECQIRLLKLTSVWQFITKEHIETVLTNIVCVDSLKYDFDFDVKPTADEIRTFQK